jgi:hypothetical protein
MCPERFYKIQDLTILHGKPESIEVKASSSMKKKCADNDQK